MTSESPRYFLELVAADLLRRAGSTDLSGYVVVFPGKRASLFFNDYLSALTGQVVWAPQYVTIDELFRSLSPLEPADHIEAVCRLYNIYVSLTHSAESLDRFYGWGEMLLSDFDDVDKNLPLGHQASELFRNVTDLRELDSSDYLDAEQREALRRLFSTYRKNESALRDNFFHIWAHMLPMYERLNAELKEQGKAYGGALYRNVVKDLASGKTSLPREVERYVFVGFNVLDRVEQELFSFLQDRGRAIFYWDYDTFYTTRHPHFEAGTFLRENLSRFPNALPESHFHNLSRPKETLELVQAPTENAQAYAVADWLSALDLSEPRRTAVVLCNENLLSAVLHSLPPEVSDINVTKGYPLAHTSVYALLERRLSALEVAEAPVANSAVLSELLSAVEERARHTQEAAEADRFMQLLCEEACFQAHTVLERFRSLVESGLLQVGFTTLRRLLRQVLRKVSLPFHGEPARGLQVMGVLETRNLDFDNVLLLSANEGMLPKAESNNSFIPYTLRRAYGLTVGERKTAVYAYYFFRLLQRARRVRCMYNVTPGASSAEISRFLLQLMTSGEFGNIRHLKLEAEPRFSALTPEAVPKPDGLLRQLNPPLPQGGCKSLSPSSLNKYIDCPLKFYYHRLARLSVADADPTDIQPNHFGNIFHHAAETLYKQLGRWDEARGAFAAPRLAKADLRKWQTAPYAARLHAIVAQAVEAEGVEHQPVVEATIEGYLRNLLHADETLPEVELVSLERHYAATISLSVGSQMQNFHVGGIVDRLDIVTDTSGRRTLRVVDYKTSRSEQSARTLDDVFDATRSHRPSYLFQTLLYALAVRQQLRPSLPLSAALFYPHLAQKPDFDPWISFGRQRLHSIDDEVLTSFEQRLRDVLHSLLDTSEPFRPNPSEAHCGHCDFRQLCGQKEARW